MIKNDPNAVEPRAVLMICPPFLPHDEKKKEEGRKESLHEPAPVGERYVLFGVCSRIQQHPARLGA